MKEAIAHYEAALKEAFPSGATGNVFHHWNEARKSLEQPAQQEPLFWYKPYPNGMYNGPIHNAQIGDVLRCSEEWIPLYTRPQAREPLTDEQKDAARWRFLVDNSFDKDGVTQFHVWEHSWEPHSQTGEPTEWKQRVRGPALDHFIDRARGEKK